MGDRFRHSAHVLRVAGLFALGFFVFLVARSVLIPRDFGVLGFYRGGALGEIAAMPIVHAGKSACLDCHGDTVPDKSVHKPLSCEGCHGPMAVHASGKFEVKSHTPEPRKLCLTCHAKVSGKPDWFKQIVSADHVGDGLCVDCHTPHNPKIDIK